MATYSFALSDELCKQYLLFKKQPTDFNKSIVSKLLRYHTGEEFIFSAQQVEDSKVEITEHLRVQLKKSRIGNGKPIDLAKKTRYKLVLTDDNSTFPYVNINDDTITPAIIGCFYQNVARDKAVSHIKALCAVAKTIRVYDKYLSTEHKYLILNDIIPNRALELQYVSTHLDSGAITELKRTLNACNFVPVHDSDTQHHDRYLIIDDKIEIVLSSGFDYLQKTNKEITYIVRPITANRFIR